MGKSSIMADKKKEKKVVSVVHKKHTIVPCPRSVYCTLLLLLTIAAVVYQGKVDCIFSARLCSVRYYTYNGSVSCRALPPTVVHKIMSIDPTTVRAVPNMCAVVKVVKSGASLKQFRRSALVVFVFDFCQVPSEPAETDSDAEESETETESEGEEDDDDTVGCM